VLDDSPFSLSSLGVCAVWNQPDTWKWWMPTYCLETKRTLGLINLLAIHLFLKSPSPDEEHDFEIIALRFGVVHLCQLKIKICGNFFKCLT
jgi:hypothetical protein